MNILKAKKRGEEGVNEERLVEKRECLKERGEARKQTWVQGSACAPNGEEVLR